MTTTEDETGPIGSEETTVVVGTRTGSVPVPRPDTHTASAIATTVATPDFAARRVRGRWRRLRRFVYAGLAVVLAITGIWLLYFSSALSVRGVEVVGNTSISTLRVERIAKAPVGTALVRVDLAAIRARVEAIPSVRSAEVSRAWPHTIRVTITERVPVAVVSRGTGADNELQAVDETGALFGRYATPPADLPLVRTSLNVKAAALAEAARVVGSLRPDIGARVENIDVESVDRIVLHLTRGVTVMWGSAEASSEKAEVLAALLKRKVSQIDVSVPGRPTTR